MGNMASMLLIGRYTFKELWKSKVLWNVVVLGAFLAMATTIATNFTYGVPGRVALDLGFACLTLSSYGVAFFAGVSLIRKEEESRTIYLIISRPVSRATFLGGKLLGVSAFVALNIAFLGLITWILVMALGSEIHASFFIALFFILLEALLLLGCLVLVSLGANTAITIIVGVLLLFAGHAIGTAGEISWLKGQPILRWLVEAYHWVLPGFYRLNFKDMVVYEQSFPAGRVLWAFLYWLLYVSGVTFAGAWAIERKEFD